MVKLETVFSYYSVGIWVVNTRNMKHSLATIIPVIDPFCSTPSDGGQCLATMIPVIDPV